MSEIKNEVRLSSSLIILRPSKDDYPYNYRILLLKRKANMSFPNKLVFPGGVFDNTDNSIISAKENNDSLKVTALRETFEECGLHLVKNFNKNFDFNMKEKNFLELSKIFPPNFSEILYFLRIITPQIVPKRYDTQFFLYMVFICYI